MTPKTFNPEQGTKIAFTQVGMLCFVAWGGGSLPTYEKGETIKRISDGLVHLSLACQPREEVLDNSRGGNVHSWFWDFCAYLRCGFF